MEQLTIRLKNIDDMDEFKQRIKNLEEFLENGLTSITPNPLFLLLSFLIDLQSSIILTSLNCIIEQYDHILISPVFL